MYNIQILSDIHIEYKNDTVPNPLNYIDPSLCDILILAGDIGSLYKYDQLFTFLTELCLYFKIVLYIPGNHEYYYFDDIPKLTFDELTERLYNLEKMIKNLFILNGKSMIIGNMCFTGCTLWSRLKIPLPKFVKIHEFDSVDYNNLFRKDVKYITDMSHYCKQNKLKLVVITHHCPTYDVLRLYDNLSSLYVSNLDHLLQYKWIPVWICGHTHTNFDIVSKGGTRVVSNQLGKPKDNINNFSKNFIISI